MSLLGLLLVITAAFCHATWNYFVKRINGGPELVWLFSLVSVVLYLPLALFILLSKRVEFGSAQVIFISGSTLLHLGYFLLLQQGYRKGDLSLVYPTARATGPLLSTTMAVLFLGEVLSWQIAAGGLAVIIGVLFLTGGLNRRAQHMTASLVFGLGAGILIGSYTVWDAYAVTALAIPPLLLDYASSVGRVLVLGPYSSKRRQLIGEYWNNHRNAVLAIAVFNPLAYILVLYALTFTPVVYVAPTRELSVLLGVLFGAILLGEGQLGRRLGWATLILGGVVLLAIA
jgi:drug/metabolite transporter (DMT)-like permease